jgi:hypothetical protein
MPMQPPQPLVQALVVCREIWELANSGEVVLIGPWSRATCASFPAMISASIYAHLSDVRGRYEIGLQLIDGEGEPVWVWPHHTVVEEHDPLMPHRVLLRQIGVEFPHSGRFHLVMQANGVGLAQHALWARRAGEG